MIALLIGAMCVVVPVAIAQDPVAILGGDGPDMLDGTPNDDALYGLGGDDTLNGLGGNDDLDGGAGADAMSGGVGQDVVSYAGPTGVTVTLNGVADDGLPGEGDNVAADVEDVFGTDGDDKLNGSGASNTIDGGVGDDIIDGGGGVDVLYGDVGNDIITSRDRKLDRVDCGAGSDRALIDRIDVTTGCESVEVIAITPGFNVAGFPTSSRSRLRSIKLVGVVTGSKVVVGCRSGCRPAASRARAIVTKRSARVSAGSVRIALPLRPAIVGGATFEVGVTAPRARHGRCSVFRVGRRINGLAQVKSLKCVSAAKTK